MAREWFTGSFTRQEPIAAAVGVMRNGRQHRCNTVFGAIVAVCADRTLRKGRA